MHTTTDLPREWDTSPLVLSELTCLGACTDFQLVDQSGIYPPAPVLKVWVSDDGLFWATVDIPVVEEVGAESFPGYAHTNSGGLHDRLADALHALAERASDFLDAAWIVERVTEAGNAS